MPNSSRSSGPHRGLCGPDGRIVAIQIENELYDQSGHIATAVRRPVLGRRTVWTIDLTHLAGRAPLELDLQLSAFKPDVIIRLTPEADRTRRQLGHGAVVRTAEIRLTPAVTVA